MDNLKFTTVNSKDDLTALMNDSLLAGEADFKSSELIFENPKKIEDSKFNTSITVKLLGDKYLGKTKLKYNRIDLKEDVIAFAISNNSKTLDLSNQDVKRAFLNALPITLEDGVDVLLPSNIKLEGIKTPLVILPTSIRYEPQTINLVAFTEKVEAGKIAIKHVNPFYNENGGPQLNRLNTQLFSNLDVINPNAFTREDLEANKRSKLVFNFGLDATGLWGNYKEWSDINLLDEKDHSTKAWKELQRSTEIPVDIAKVINLIKEQNYGESIFWSRKNMCVGELRNSQRLKSHQIEDRVPSIAPFYIAKEKGVKYLTYGGDVYYSNDDKSFAYERWSQAGAHSLLFRENWVNEYNIKKYSDTENGKAWLHETKLAECDLIKEGNFMDLFIIPFKEL